ncbi:phosphotransferase [Synechococcus sp. Tobar12-5m-g]|uniref:phosphotransferase enzyme family protein n=1 Tax=unclassified Synechococcus TaxID=2626047 RepID=UPI0020CF1BDD|nr:MULTISPECIES: phosphotransferase [unclassified Synechococcus]MCP9772646.1 phosphotransferase [Synechococcus sp. Tobar12-5m-g]MCP9873498.1 phosphotransferase [Synechococcus sp. Cruz CV-v-12]
MTTQQPWQFPDDLERIAGQFDLGGAVASIEPLGNGNVNDTYRVTLQAQGAPAYVLQRLNTRVFPQPELVMGNLLLFSEHVALQLRNGCPFLADRRWEVPRVVPARSGGLHWVEDEGCFWRLLSFLEGAHCFETVSSLAHAREVGHGLGMFHALISDLPVGALADTLVGFHITPTYLSLFHQVLANPEMPLNPGLNACPELEDCLSFVRAREGFVSVLEDAKSAGILPLRPIHGDPKINNVMIDASTGQAIALVDLDTVKPGLVHYDIGDCLRSCCNRLGEETTDWPAVRFDPLLCEAVLQGYGAVASSFLTSHDYAYLFAAIRLIPFELGLRFLTDYLAGSHYFKIQHPRHNLDRALVQFKLTESIEVQEAEIRSIIEAMR